MTAESDSGRGPLSQGGIAPQPLFAVVAVLLGSFLANFDSRLTTVGLADLRGAFSLGFDEGAWLSTAGIGSQIFIAPAVAWLAAGAEEFPGRLLELTVAYCKTVRHYSIRSV